MKIEQQLGRLSGAGFRLLDTPEISTHYVVERGSFAVLIERCPDGAFGQMGAPGLLTDGVFAVLAGKPDAPQFVAKGKNFPATPERLQSLRKFEQELRAALGE